jgi:hypothetical protein
MKYEVEFNVIGGQECLFEYDNGPIPRVGEKVYWDRKWYRVEEVQHQPRKSLADRLRFGHVIVNIAALEAAP